MAVERRDVTFPSGDASRAAWFFLPRGPRSSGPLPAVAMAHGMGAVKEMYLEQFARRFAEAEARRPARTIPLAQAAQAHRDLEAGALVGKFVLAVTA